jgi:hypothetical protein
VSVVTGVSAAGVQEITINTILSGNKKKYLKRFMNEILAQIILTGVSYFVKMDFRLHLQDESSYFVCKCFNSFSFSHYFNRYYSGNLGYFFQFADKILHIVVLKCLFIHTNKFVTGVLSNLCLLLPLQKAICRLNQHD